MQSLGWKTSVQTTETIPERLKFVDPASYSFSQSRRARQRTEFHVELQVEQIVFEKMINTSSQRVVSLSTL